MALDSELDKYLLEHSSARPAQSDARVSFREILREEVILELPELLNVEDMLVYYKVEFKLGEFKRPHVDLAVRYDSGMAIVELKRFDEGRSKITRKTINKQLRRSYNFFENNFHIEPMLIGIYARKHTEGFWAYTINRDPENKPPNFIRTPDEQ